MWTDLENLLTRDYGGLTEATEPSNLVLPAAALSGAR
jgi:hypothetical protein